MELHCTQVKYNFALQAGQELLTNKNSAMKLELLISTWFYIIMES